MKHLLLFISLSLFSCSFTGVKNTSVSDTKVSLDDNPQILDWYIDGNDTIIYTVTDSIYDEIQRRKFIDSLYNSN
jgi:hypothetical protein